ncbi:MAG: CotH kinase family protein [Bacilli bacterium]|nr:CotH kinase family protein [Bacilli bacterium]
MKISCFALCISITFLCACSSPKDPEPDPGKEFEVKLDSKTLKIDNFVAKENTDYNAKFSFVEENYNYRFPDKILLYIDGNRISSDQYNYSFDTGNLLVDKSLIKGDLRIVGEWTIIDGYQVNFETDSHIHFYFYKTRNYSTTPIEDTIAIARDFNGNPITDGTGEINFKYEIDNNYEKDLFWVCGMSDGIKEIGTSGIYRIENIKSNIRVCLSSKKAYCKNLCASADYDNRSFTFSWDVDESIVESVDIDIVHGVKTKHDNITSIPYTFNDDSAVAEEELYQFTFTPILKNGSKGDSIKKDMMLSSSSRFANFPRVEINTKDDLLPPYNVVKDPSGRFNVSIVNNNYVQNIIKIFDDQNNIVYDSSDGNPSDFDKSKIKVRGNTSTVESNGKESYKIKLANKVDLLDPFLNRSTQLGGDAYKDKEWLLLNCGNQLNELGGFSIENTLKNALEDSNVLKKDWWVPQCQYVTLFMNSDFKGIYILCEAVTKGNVSETTPSVQSRCPISDDGFIVENDAYNWKENLTFKTHINQEVKYMEYTFKYPDSDDLIQDGGYENEKYLYISDCIKEFENYFYASPIDSRYKNYIDVESFALWTVAHDLMHVSDQYGSNMFIYKKDSSNNSKLTAGTTWDFDSAFIGNLDEEHPRGLCFHRSSDFYYIRGFKNVSEFIDDTQGIFDKSKENIVNDFESYIGYLTSKENVYNALLNTEAKRFGTDQVQFIDQVNQIKHFLQVQIAYINEHSYSI